MNILNLLFTKGSRLHSLMVKIYVWNFHMIVKVWFQLIVCYDYGCVYDGYEIKTLENFKFIFI